MYKILVTVDFSVNSRKSIRFALQLASQIKAEVIFIHVVSMYLPSSDKANYSEFQKEEVQLVTNDLVKLIRGIYNEKLTPKVKYSCECVVGDNVSKSIMLYAKKHHIDFVCVGARGAGLIAKLFGNNTTNLIMNSPIPVFVIPKNYRLKALSTICYASDMENIEIELKKVVSLANSLQTTLKVIHFEFEYELKKNRDKLTAIAEKYETKEIKFHYKKFDTIRSFNEHLNAVIAKFKPSLVVLFTKQNRRWIDKLLLDNHSADMSYTTKVPLLIYRKMKK